MYPLFDLLALSGAPVLGPSRLRALVHHCGGAAGALKASPGEIAAVPGFGDRLALQVWSFLHDRSGRASRFAESQLSALERSGAAIVTVWEENYPELLKRIFDPPVLLYVRGALSPDDRFAIALVGTRQPSAYGLAAAERFSRECVGAGLCVVSGLARGIDTAAHAAAAKGPGRTIAVIGSGLDVAYPPENAPLAGEIALHGAVVSEYPMGTKPEAANFPRRNRIISGLALGTVVIESDLTGGAMITARLALDQNREVFAVPGPALARTSLGCHALIRDGRAKLVEDLGDVLSELVPALKPLVAPPEPPQRPLTQASLFDPE